MINKKIINLVLISAMLSQFMFMIVPQPVAAEPNNSSGLARGDADKFEKDQGPGFSQLIDYIFGGLKWFYRIIVYAAVFVVAIGVIFNRWRHNSQKEADNMDDLVYIGICVVAVIAISYVIDWLFKHFF